MPGKYYIADSANFLDANGNIVSSLAEAKRYKFTDAQKAMEVLDETVWAIKQNYKSGKKYVISSAKRFVDSNTTVSRDYRTAWTFKSVADANAFINNHRDIKKLIPSPVVVDKNFEKVESSVRRQFTDDQLKVLGVDTCKATPRKKIKRELLDKAWDDSQGICALCGKPMTFWNKTVDHIVPLSKGGDNKRENIRYVHQSCNRVKGCMDDSDMYKATTSIDAKYVYDNPTSSMTTEIIRAYLRGIIRERRKRE